MTKVTFGKYGEDLACRYLEKQGYKILERNFRIRGGEIDIISQNHQNFVFLDEKL